MEVAARELIPELLAQAPPGTRFTAFVNRETAAAGGGPWGELLPAVTVPDARRATASSGWSASRPCSRHWRRGRGGSGAQPGQHRSVWGPLPTGGDCSRSRLRPLSRRARRDPRQGHAGAGACAARRSHRVIVDSQSTREDLIGLLGVPSTHIDVVPLGSRQPCGRRRSAARDARFVRGSTSTSGACCSEPLRQAPHKNLAALMRPLAPLSPEASPSACAPRLSPPHEIALRELALALGVGDDVRFLDGCSEARSSRVCGSLPRRSCSPRCMRASGYRCSRRWRAGAGLRLGGLVAARGRRRRRAAVRPSR